MRRANEGRMQWASDKPSQHVFRIMRTSLVAPAGRPLFGPPRDNLCLPTPIASKINTPSRVRHHSNSDFDDRFAARRHAGQPVVAGSRWGRP